MKVQIPDELKKDVPQTTFGKILSATPVVMAVVSTMLAGLASSEMTRAQYDRSLAAQQQSKAGDQWSFFQAKRLRGAIQHNTAELLQTVTELRTLDPSALRQSAEQFPTLVGKDNATPERQTEASRIKMDMMAWLDSATGQQTLGFLRQGEVPKIPSPTAPAPSLKAALDGLENLKTDAEMMTLLAPVSNAMLDDALRTARDQTQSFDLATKPINQAIDQMDALLVRQSACQPKPAGAEAKNIGIGAGATFYRDFTAARLRYAAVRYEVEARLNQGIANLYELQVRKSNISAERHHRRSQRFFFGMLGAQLGVIISTLAMAARNRNLLWSLAAAAGLLAILFAIYVYLYV